MGTISVDKLVKTSLNAAEFTLPATDGTAGQVWQTDGSGQISVAALAADTVGTNQLTNDVVISTSGSITTTGAFTSVGIDDNADATAITINSAEKVGIGITAPEAKLHVQTATAGSVTPHGNADELVVENSGSAGMSFLSPAGNEQFIMFGDADDNDIGSISYNHYYNYLMLRANAIDTMQIKAGNIVMNGLGGIGNFLATMGDDTVTSITPACNRGIIFCGSNSTHFGGGAFVCINGGTTESYIFSNLNANGTFNFTTGVLANGTAGTNGKMNISAANDGKLYFNNRLGGGAAFWYTIVGAMW